jgi:HAD superfamily hydrolase (TIGR01509 family)
VELTPRPDCVLFDCDGTLVDSELLGNVALAQELALGGIVETGESLTERFRGHKLADMLATLQADHGVALPDGFVDRYRARAAAMFETGVQRMPGVAEALEGLGLPMCIVSNGPIAKIRQSLRVAGLAGWFGERLFSAYEVGSWKPDPGLFLHAARAMGVEPARCVVVDDSATGVEAARRAGMRALWHLPHGATTEIPPHATAFSHMDRLADLIGR